MRTAADVLRDPKPGDVVGYVRDGRRLLCESLLNGQ